MLAVASYLWLSSIAGQVVTLSKNSGLPATLKGLATLGQYLVPFLLFIGAAVSASRQERRKKLITDVAASQAWQPLESITWQEFEILVGEAFRLHGYKITENNAGGADGGIDLVLRKGNEKFFVQCKQWKAYSVGVAIVRELYGVLAAERAVGGFVVTSGQFTKDAEAFAKGRNVELIDGPQLMKMIKGAQAARRSSAAATLTDEFPAVLRPVEPEQDAVEPTFTPSCPICSKAMVKRTARKGPNAGQTFWGCSGYPSCRGTRPAT